MTISESDNNYKNDHDNHNDDRNDDEDGITIMLITLMSHVIIVRVADTIEKLLKLGTKIKIFLKYLI